MALTDAPLLGVAGTPHAAELELARKFDQLHQLIYSAGGIRPTNAALEEVAKLVFLRLWATQEERRSDAAGKLARDLFHPTAEPLDLVVLAKDAFRVANSSSRLGVRGVGESVAPLWPSDEPFRLDHEEVLRQALALVDSLVSDEELRVADPLGTAFDAFLSGRYDHAGGLGTYLTPSGVARAMAEVAFAVADPLEGWDLRSPAVLDPFCGTGRFLVAAFEAAEVRADERVLSALLEEGLAGADQSSSAVAKTALNLMLYGAHRPHVLRVEDSVTAPELDALSGRLPLVLTNPPFGSGKYHSPLGLRRTADAIPSVATKTAVDPALACTVRAARLLAPGGVLGIVLPDGVVDGRQFGELLERERELSVVANLSLPTATFSLSGTVAKTSAVFLQRGRERKRTVLAVVGHVGFLKQKGKAAPDPEGSDLPAVVERVRGALLDESASVDLVRHSETPLVASVASKLLASLDPNRLDAAAFEARTALEQAGGVRLSTYLRAKRKVRQATQEGVPFVSVLHVDSLGVVGWPEAETYSPTTPGQVAHGGDLLVSLLNPSKLRAAVVSSDYPAVLCSAEFGVFSSSVDPYAVLGLLYRPEVQAQLRPLGRGTSSSRRRVRPQDVLDLVVPHLTGEELEALGATVRSATASVEAGRAALFRAFDLRADELGGAEEE